jgi:hypothetical protein
MRRALLITVMLIGAAGIATSSQTVYPKLTRRNSRRDLGGNLRDWASPFVFHIVIAPSDSDSYLSEIYLESMKGR